MVALSSYSRGDKTKLRVVQHGRDGAARAMRTAVVRTTRWCGDARPRDGATGRHVGAVGQLRATRPSPRAAGSGVMELRVQLWNRSARWNPEC